MKHICLALCFFLSFFWGCSDSSNPVSNMTEKDFEKSIDEIETKGILVDFINDISNRDFEKAQTLILPQLRDAWGKKRFIEDLEGVRSIVENWSPEITNSFIGNSQQGPYKQLTYKLDSKWNSLSSIDLISMKTDKEEYIVRIHIRIPYRNIEPKPLQEITQEFIQSMFNEQYSTISDLMSENCKKQFTVQTLKQLRPLLGDKPSELEKSYYRICANTVWYDAVKINTKGNMFTFMEIIFSENNQKMQIETISFRGAMG